MARTPAVALFTCLLTLAVASAAAQADGVKTIDGDSQAVVKSIVDQGASHVVVTDQGQIPADEVREIRFDRAGSAVTGLTARVFLRGGDEIPGKLTGGNEDAIIVASPTLGSVEVPLERIAGLTFTNRPEDVDRFRREALAADPETDYIVLASTWARQERAIVSLSEAGAEVEIPDVGLVTLPPERLVGVRLAPLGPLEPMRGSTARLGLSCGATVEGKLDAFKGGFFRIDLPYHEALKLPARYVKSLRFQGGRFTYLSDLTPKSVDERSQVIRIVFPYKRDQSVTGAPIRLGGKRYAKGIGVKAYTKLTFELGGAYQGLRCVIGLDDSTRQRSDVTGTARFQVLADGRPLLGKTGLQLSSRDAPKALNLKLSGVQRLELVCDFGPSGDMLARGVWADAFLLK